MRSLEAIVGAPIVEDVRAAWGFENETHLVTTADGRRLAVQRLRDRSAARTRLQVLTIEERLRAADIPVPVSVTGRASDAGNDGGADDPLLVTVRIDGQPGNSLLDEPDDARLLARAMGQLQRRVAGIDVGVAIEAGLDETWIDPAALARSTRAWMADAAAWLDDDDRLAIERRIEDVPRVLTGRIGVLAHGDFVPVNVLVRDRSIVALLDWEDARIADPTLDVGWWLWVVHHHHPAIHQHIATEFRDAAGVPSDAATRARMELFVTLRLLEILARSRSTDAERARRRVATLRAALSGDAAAAFGP